MQATSLGAAIQALHSPLFHELRQTFERGEWPAGCNRCRVEEANGILSMRQSERPYKTPSDLAHPTLLELEISVGRICNLKCRTCSAEDSTKWESEDRQRCVHKSYSPPELELLSQIPDDLRSLRYLKITGGEPFLHPQFAEFLERLADLRPPALDIEIYTNCTHFPSERALNALSKLPRVKIALSIDAIEARAEYVRHGVRWPQIVTVAEKWRDWKTGHPERLLSAAVTISLLNIFYLSETMSWLSQHLKIQKRYLQVVQWPQELSVLSAPLPFKEALRAHLHTSLERDIPALNPSDVIHRLGSSPGTSGHLKRFVESVQAMDAVRGESFTKTFPEYWTVLQEHLQD